VSRVRDDVDDGAAAASLAGTPPAIGAGMRPRPASSAGLRPAVRTAELVVAGVEERSPTLVGLSGPNCFTQP